MDPSEPPKHDPFGIKNDEGLTVTQIIGRCSVCSTHGTLDPVKNKLPASVIDAMLSYKIVPKIFCRTCMRQTEFIPTDVKKYKDLPLLARLQDQVINGVPQIPAGLLDSEGRPLEKN